MKRFREFLSLRAIVGSLPFNIQNGQIEDATPVMANFNFLASQVNANAQPAGVLAEWVPSGLTPTFISATQFSVPGNVTAIFNVKRRVLLTVTAVNGGSTITASSFGGGNTTVTVVTDTAGFLTAGLTAVSYGLLDASILSTPKKTNIQVQIDSSGTNLVTNTAYTVGGGSPWATNGVTGDDFAEYNSGTGIFTILQKGRYLVAASLKILLNGATITSNGQWAWGVNAGNQATSFWAITSPASSLVLSDTLILSCNAGDTVKFFSVANMTFTGGPAQATGGYLTLSQQF